MLMKVYGIKNKLIIAVKNQERCNAVYTVAFLKPIRNFKIFLSIKINKELYKSNRIKPSFKIFNSYSLYPRLKLINSSRIVKIIS